MDPDFFSFSDWIEIYNAEDTVINIGGYFITDDLSNNLKFQIPQDSFIEPRGYFVIWADGNDTSGLTVHTNFKLNKNGEEIGLFNQNGTIIDTVRFKDQLTNISYGRDYYEVSNWFYFFETTFNNSNMTNTYIDTIRNIKPVSSLLGGFYNDSQSIELFSNNDSDIIRYTVDGSKPKINSQIYNFPIIIDSTTVIRAIAINNDNLPSLVSTNSFFINEQHTVPVISISSDKEYFWNDQTGIYSVGEDYNGGVDPNANYTKDWERPINIEFFNNSASEYALFNIDAGIKIHGGFSRNFPQKSLSIYLKSKYGYPILNFQLFDEKNIDIKIFVLRNGGNDWNHAMLLDRLFTSLISNKIDIDYQSHKPSIVYINGKYWGIHNIREKIDEYYVKSNYGIDENYIDMLENDPFENGINIIEGSSENYYEIIDYIAKNDIRMIEHYNYIEDKIDMNEYINYQICQIYFANSDWPMNNQKYWCPRTNDGKWRWVLYDLEMFIVKRNYMYDMLSRATEINPNSYDFTFLFRELLNNDFFKNTFIQRFSHYLGNIFSTYESQMILDSIHHEIEQEILEHSNRWKDSCLIREDGREYCGIQSENEWLNEINFY